MFRRASVFVPLSICAARGEEEGQGIVFLKSLVGSLRLSRVGSPPREASHPFTHVPPLPPWLPLRAVRVLHDGETEEVMGEQLSKGQGGTLVTPASGEAVKKRKRNRGRLLLTGASTGCRQVPRHCRAG